MSDTTEPVPDTSEAATAGDPAPAGLAAALEMEVDGTTVHAHVHHGFDVFGIPHGGYLAAIAARAVLLVAGEPDLFTVTVHYLRKAATGPMDVEVTRVGGSRRFTSFHATARQDGEVVLSALASVGERTGFTGPTWSDTPPLDPAHERWSAPAGSDGEPFPTPRVAHRFNQQLAMSTVGFAMGELGERALLHARVDACEVDQLTALVACDLTPPAAWNALGMQGWVPTIELTAHVRARPVDGPMTVEVTTHHVADGFLEEDALVRDAEGRLVVQSRQLARWTGT